MLKEKRGVEKVFFSFIFNAMIVVLLLSFIVTILGNTLNNDKKESLVALLKSVVSLAMIIILVKVSGGV